MYDASGGAWVVQAEYEYDALNRRVDKRYVPNLAAPTVSRWEFFVYDADRVVMELYDLDFAGIPATILTARSFAYNSYIDAPLVLVDEEGAVLGSPLPQPKKAYYLEDRRYGVAALADEAGAIRERYRYEAFGAMTVYQPGIGGWVTRASQSKPNASAFNNPYGFTGRRYDAETATTTSGGGLWYYRNRMYSSKLGRFLQRDPAGYVDGYNLYAYVRNNPLAFVDAFGLSRLNPQTRARLGAINDVVASVQPFDFSSTSFFDARSPDAVGARYGLSDVQLDRFAQTPGNLPTALRVAMATGEPVTFSAGNTGALLGSGFDDEQAVRGGFDNLRVSSGRDSLVSFFPDGTSQVAVPLEFARNRTQIINHGDFDAFGASRPEVIREQGGASAGFATSAPFDLAGSTGVGLTNGFIRNGARGATNDFQTRNTVAAAQLKVTLLSAGTDGLAGFIPGVGEVQDARVLSNSDNGLLDRGIAGVSLTANLFFLGFAPNFGSASKSLRSLDDVASSAKVTQVDEVFHFTQVRNADSIANSGLRAGPQGVFTTPSGNLSPLQAQLDLALPPNRGLPDALFRIDLNEVRRLGIDIGEPRQVGRMFNLPGGGTEIIINGNIPPSALERIR